MVGISFIRVFKAASQNFWRNIWLSVATTVIMTMTLLIVLFLFFANIFGLEVLHNVEQKVDLSVTFADSASEEQIAALAREIGSRDDVKGVEVVTSEQALAIFRQRNQDKPFIEESLAELEKNPLPASMFIVATEPRFYQAMAGDLASERYAAVIAAVNFEDSRAVIDRLMTIILAIKNVGLVVTVIFVVLVVLIMFNTVRLAIYSFREEIDIMHLVGASRWFIRGPFVLESILVALLAVAVASAIAYPALKAASPELQRFFFESHADSASFDIYQYAVDRWFTILGLQVVLAAGLAIFSSLIAVQRYLKN